MHVEVDVDERARLDAGAQLGVAAPVVPAAGDARVDVLEVVGDRAPRPRRGRRAQPLAQRRVGDEVREPGGQRVGVADLEHDAALAVARDLLVDRQAADERDRPRRLRAPHESRLRRGAVGRGDEDVGAGEERRLVAVCDELDALA